MAILVKMKCISFFFFCYHDLLSFYPFARQFRPTFELLDDRWQKEEFIFTTWPNNGEQQTNVEQLVAIFQFNLPAERPNINSRTL